MASSSQTKKTKKQRKNYHREEKNVEKGKSLPFL